MNKVFHCPKCSLIFDKDIRVPLTLPCGHVICRFCLTDETCMKKIKCSIDNTIYNVSVKSLPLCQTILEHLPSFNTSKFLCKTHQEKTIKYYCSTCQLTLCSKCICKHMSPHKVITFSPTKASFLEEIDKIMENTVSKKTEIEVKEKEFKRRLKKIDSINKEDSTKLIETIDQLIDTLNQIKRSVNSIMINKTSLQKDEISHTLKKINKDKDLLSNLQITMNNFIQMINSNNKIVYEDVDKEKKDVIQQWETVLKHTMNDIILIKQQEDTVTKPNNERLYKAFKKQYDIFEQLLGKCEGTPNLFTLYKKTTQGGMSNKSTRELTQKSLQKNYLYSSTKNINTKYNIIKVGERNKYDDLSHIHRLFTDNI